MSGALHFDIDTDQLKAAAEQLGASEKQVKLAFSAACSRTATTLRTRAARGLASELQLRTISLLRKRLKSLRISAGSAGFRLWFGLNDMPASWFKGRAKQTATGAQKQGQAIAGAFVAKSKFKGRQTLFKRTGKARLQIQEQNLQVEDRAVVYIEDEIFDQADEIFWRYFMRELRARVSYKIGER